MEPNTCEKATLTGDVGETCFDKNFGEVKNGEFYWTEHGARLHSERCCVYLRRGKRVFAGTLCKLGQSANAHSK